MGFKQSYKVFGIVLCSLGLAYVHYNIREYDANTYPIIQLLGQQSTEIILIRRIVFGLSYISLGIVAFLSTKSKLEQLSFLIVPALTLVDFLILTYYFIIDNYFHSFFFVDNLIIGTFILIYVIETIPRPKRPLLTTRKKMIIPALALGLFLLILVLSYLFNYPDLMEYRKG